MEEISLDVEIKELEALLERKRQEKKAFDLAEIASAIAVLRRHSHTISIISSKEK